MVASINGGPIWISKNTGADWSNTSIIKAWTSLTTTYDGSVIYGTESTGTVWSIEDGGSITLKSGALTGASVNGITTICGNGTSLFVAPIRNFSEPVRSGDYAGGSYMNSYILGYSLPSKEITSCPNYILITANTAIDVETIKNAGYATMTCILIGGGGGGGYGHGCGNPPPINTQVSVGSGGNGGNSGGVFVTPTIDLFQYATTSIVVNVGTGGTGGLVPATSATNGGATLCLFYTDSPYSSAFTYSASGGVAGSNGIGEITSGTSTDSTAANTPQPGKSSATTRSFGTPGGTGGRGIIGAGGGGGGGGGGLCIQGLDGTSGVTGAGPAGSTTIINQNTNKLSFSTVVTSASGGRGGSYAGGAVDGSFPLSYQYGCGGGGGGGAFTDPTYPYLRNGANGGNGIQGCVIVRLA